MEDPPTTWVPQTVGEKVFVLTVGGEPYGNGTLESANVIKLSFEGSTLVFECDQHGKWRDRDTGDEFVVRKPKSIHDVLNGDKDLVSAELPSTNLKDQNLSNINLNMSNLENSFLFGASFENCNMTYSNLSGVKAWDTNFRGANLQYVSLKNIMLNASTDFTGANLQFSQWEGAYCAEQAIYDIYERETPPNYIPLETDKKKSTSTPTSSKVAVTEDEADVFDEENNLVRGVKEENANPSDLGEVESDFSILDEPKWTAVCGLWYVQWPILTNIAKEMYLVIWTESQLLSAYTDEITLVTEMVKRLFEFETSRESWREALSIWELFYGMEFIIKNPKVRSILVQLYSDKMDKVLGMGKQMIEIEGLPPEGVVKEIKSLTSRVRINYLRKMTELNEEQGRIDAVKDMKESFQQRMFGVLVALSVGLANFFGRLAFVFYFATEASSDDT